MCLQETKCIDEKLPLENFEKLGYKFAAFRGEKSYNGVLILSKRKILKIERFNFCGKDDARHIGIELEDGVKIHNLYIPAGGDLPDTKLNPKFEHKINFLSEIKNKFFKGKKKKPALIMKTSGAGFSVIDRKDIFKKIKMIQDNIQSDDLPDVYLLHGDLTDEEMNQMYNHPKVKAHLTFTHGEGFGRPLLEASFSGKPILAPIATGQADFLDKMYTVELPHIMTKVPPGAFPKEYHNPEAGWATVNYGMASKLMRDVYQNYPKYQLKGKKQMLVNRQMFTHEKMSKKLIYIVDKMLEGVPQPVKLKIPSLTKEPKKLKLPTLKKG